MAKSSSKSGKKGRPRVARAVPAVPEPVGPAEEPEAPAPAALEGAAEIDRALDDALPEAPPSSTGDNGAAAAEEPAAPLSPPRIPEGDKESTPAEVGELPPHLRKRKGRPGRRTRRELEREVKELREYLGKVAPGEQPEPTAAAPVVVDYTEAGEMVGFVLDMIFEAMAEEKGDHWRMSEAKLARAKEHGGRFIGPHLPKLGSLLPLIFFCGVVGKHSLSAWRIDRSRNGTPAAAPPAPAAPPPGGIN